MGLESLQHGHNQSTPSRELIPSSHNGETGQIFQRVAPKPRKKSDMKIHDPAHEAMVEGMHSLFKSEQPQHDPFNQKGSNVSASSDTDDDSGYDSSETSQFDLSDGADDENEDCPKHPFYWLTRSNRKAACAGCGRTIDAWTYRLVFQPYVGDVIPKSDALKKWGDSSKGWKNTFYKYFHIRRTCLNHPDLTPPLEHVQCDVAMLPKREKETAALRRETTEAAMLLLETEFSAR